MGTRGCAVYRVSTSALLLHARELDGERIRLTGVVLVECRDETLYFNRLAADSLRREEGLRLFGNFHQFAGLEDSLTVVELEGVFGRTYGSGVRVYGGFLDQVVLRVTVQGNPR